MDTAAQRMAARFLNARLLPSSIDDFPDWLRFHGIEPDSETASELYIEVADTCGWAESFSCHSSEVELLLRKQWVGGSNPPDSTISALRPALAAEMAAKRFLDWLADEGREGAYLAADLEGLYLEHATAIGREPTPQSPLRQALKAMGIVSETIKTGHRAGNRKERRIRSVQWQLFKKVAAPQQRTPNLAVARLAERLAA